MSLPVSVLSWRGFTVGNGTRWTIDVPGITGWEESTPGEKLSESRADSYGDRDTPFRAKGRTVQLAGFVKSGTDRDELVAAFRRAFTLPEDPRQKDELTITTAGRTLMAYAQCTGRKIIQGPNWGIGRFGWALQFQADDYLRYDEEITVEADLTVPTGGITPPLTPPINLPFRPKSGVITVNNPGDRLTPMIVELIGPQAGVIGVDQITQNRRLTYTAPLAAAAGSAPADHLVIDTRKGYAVLNGDAYRSALPGSSVTRMVGLVPGVNEIRATGTAPGGGTPKIRIRFRPASE